MFRYYRRNWGLAVVALSAGILHQLCTPLVAVMEQKLVDYVVAGNMEAFCESMLYGTGGAFWSRDIFYGRCDVQAISGEV